MSALLIKDYLRTQGLHLPAEGVHIAYLAAQAVINNGNASIDRSILWFGNDELVLADHIEQTSENEALLKQIFMALDSVFGRNPDILSATVYAKMPSENPVSQLIRLTHQGRIPEQKLDITDDNSRTYLASRTAQSGWMNIANDVPRWLSSGELEGGRNHAGKSQISAPVCTENGTILGVLHIEYPETDRADEAALTDWTALALALAEPMKSLLKIEEKNEDQL